MANGGTTGQIPGQMQPQFGDKNPSFGLASGMASSQPGANQHNPRERNGIGSQYPIQSNMGYNQYPPFQPYPQLYHQQYPFQMPMPYVGYNFAPPSPQFMNAYSPYQSLGMHMNSQQDSHRYQPSYGSPQAYPPHKAFGGQQVQPLAYGARMGGDAANKQSEQPKSNQP